MERNLFSQYADDLMRLGVEGVGHAGLILGHEGKYDLWYTPFENVNRNAKLVIVGITPGNTQLEMAYKKSQDLLKARAISGIRPAGDTTFRAAPQTSCPQSGQPVAN